MPNGRDGCGRGRRMNRLVCLHCQARGQEPVSRESDEAVWRQVLVRRRTLQLSVTRALQGSFAWYDRSTKQADYCVWARGSASEYVPGAKSGWRNRHG